MKTISFNTFEEAKSVCDRVKSDAHQSGLISNELIGYVMPVKTEFWSIPLIPGFEAFFTPEEFINSAIVEGNFNEIRPSQGKIQLHRMGILDSISQMIDASEDAELKIFWEYALVWEIDNQYVIQLAQSLGMTSEQINDFFFQASQIR